MGQGLKKQNVSLPITGGMDQSIQKWLVPEGKLTDCQNVEFDKQGAAVHRNGFGPTTMDRVSGTINIPYTLAEHGDEKLIHNAYQLWGYTPSVARWVQKDEGYPCLVGQLRCGRQGPDNTTPRVEGTNVSAAVTTNGYVGVVRMAFETDSNVGFEYAFDVDIIERTTGQLVHRERFTDPAVNYSYPKIVASGDHLVVTWRELAGANVALMGAWIECTAGGLASTWNGPTTLLNPAADIGKYDLSSMGGWIYIAAHSAGGGADILLRRYDRELVGWIGGTETSAGVAGTIAEMKGISISAAAGGGGIILGWLIQAGAGPAVYTVFASEWEITGAPAWAQLNARTGIANYEHDAAERECISVLAKQSGAYRIAFSYIGTTAGGAVTARTAYWDRSSAWGATGPRYLANVFLAGPLFEWNFNVYHLAYEYDAYSGIAWSPGAWASTMVEDAAYAYLLIDTRTNWTHASERPRCVASAQIGSAVWPIAVHQHHLAAETGMYGGIAYLGVPYITEIARAGSVSPHDQSMYGFTVLRFDFTDQSRVQHAEIGGYTVFGNGALASYDGDQLVECAFPFYPKILAAVAAGGGVEPANNLYYKAIYDIYDRLGNRIMSCPTHAPIGLLAADNLATGYKFDNTAAGGNVTVKVLAPSLTGWTDHENYERFDVGVSLYRFVSSTGQYHFVRRESFSYDTANALYFDWVSIQDNLADTTIDSNEMLYTGGGVLPNDTPPPGHILVSHRNRLWVVSDEDPEYVYFSKEYIPDRPVEFSLALYLRIADQHGGITGMASMDNTLLLFKDKRIYAVTGEGPGPNGLPVDGFSQPQVVSSNVGCLDCRSIVSAPAGVFFRSVQGFCVIDRGFNVSFIGRPIEDSAAAYPYTYGGCMLRGKGVVRWLVSGSAIPVQGTSTPPYLLDYNYESDQWSKHKTGWAEQTVSHRISDIVSWDDSCHLAYDFSTSPTIMRQASGVYGDGGYMFVSSVWWAWLKLGNLQDFKRIWRTRVLTETLNTPAAGPPNTAAGVKIYHRYDYDDMTTDTYTWTRAQVVAFADRDGTVPLTVGQPEQFEVHCKQQKVQSMRVGFEIYDCLYGPGLRIVGLDFEVGIKRGGYKNLSAGRRT